MKVPEGIEIDQDEVPQYQKLEEDKEISIIRTAAVTARNTDLAIKHEPTSQRDDSGQDSKKQSSLQADKDI